MQAIAGLESAFDAPLFPTNSSHLYCHKRAEWGRQNGACPWVRETLGTPLSQGEVDQTELRYVSLDLDNSRLDFSFLR